MCCINKNIRGRPQKTSAVRGRGFVQCGQGGSSSDADVRTFWHKKLLIFKIYGMSVRTGGKGVSQCGHFAGGHGGEMVNFSQFCADVFDGQPLRQIIILIWVQVGIVFATINRTTKTCKANNSSFVTFVIQKSWNIFLRSSIETLLNITQRYYRTVNLKLRSKSNRPSFYHKQCGRTYNRRFYYVTERGKLTFFNPFHDFDLKKYC